GASSSTAPSGDPTPTDPAPTYGHGHDPPLGFHILSSPPHRQWSPRTATTRRPLAGGHPPRTRASQQERSRRRYLESPARASPSAEVAIRRMAGPLPASWDSRISLGNSPRPTLQRVEPDFRLAFRRIVRQPSQLDTSPNPVQPRPTTDRPSDDQEGALASSGLLVAGTTPAKIRLYEGHQVPVEDALDISHFQVGA